MLLHFTCHVVFTDCAAVIYQFKMVIHHFRAPLAMLCNDFHCTWFFFFFLNVQILLDASTIQLGSLPLGVYTASPSDASQEQALYELCVCPSGKIYLSPAESSSTCQAMSNICLWSWPGTSIGGKGGCWRAKTPSTSALGTAEFEMGLLCGYIWQRAEITGAKMELRLAQRQPSPLPSVVSWGSGLLCHWQRWRNGSQSSSLTVIRNMSFKQKHFHYLKLRARGTH